MLRLKYIHEQNMAVPKAKLHQG